jgi:hypothetical protein
MYTNMEFGMYVDCELTDKLCTKRWFYVSSYEYKIIGRGEDLTLFMDF